MLDEDKEKYLNDLDNAYKNATSNKASKIENKDAIKEYILSNTNIYLRKLQQDIKIFKNAEILKISKDKEKELQSKNKLDGFCEFCIAFINILDNTKKIDMRV